jgi:hypothetical protein
MNGIKNLVAGYAFVGAPSSPPLSLSKLQRRNILLASLPIPYGITVCRSHTYQRNFRSLCQHASLHHTKAYPIGPYDMGVMDIKSPQFTDGLPSRLAPRLVEAEINPDRFDPIYSLGIYVPATGHSGSWFSFSTPVVDETGFKQLVLSSHPSPHHWTW